VSLSINRSVCPRPKSLIAVVAMLAFLVGFTHPLPARADGAASTRNIILAGVAIAAAIIISNNIRHKQLAHDTVVGRTADGGIVYADGRVVYPNGDVLYTSNGDGRPCGWSNDEEPCGPSATAYYPRGYNGHDHGNHYGWYKEKHREHHGDHHDGGDDEHD
jgi:hypothetical protein